jgi:hypothetical protein
MKRYLAVTFGLVVGAFCVLAFRHHHAGPRPEPSWQSLRLAPESLALGAIHSVEHGYAIFLQEVAAKQETRRIHLYRLSDGRIVTINLLDHVKDADELNVYDAALGKSGLVAVGANAESRRSGGEEITAVLLLYDTEGSLVAHRAFPPKTAGPILRLAVDDDDAVWAVRRGREGADPASEPFLYRYTESGRTETVVYTRAGLPDLGFIRPYVRQVGSPSLGLTRDDVYVWLPGIQELVIMAKNGSELRRYPVPVPQSSEVTPETQVNMVRLRLTESGVPLSDTRYLTRSIEPRRNADRGIFRYDLAQRVWQRLRYDLPPTVELLGVDGEQVILGTKWKSWTEEDSSYQLFRR